MSVATEIKRLQDAKVAIKESITNKNVEVPDDVHVDKYNEYVDQIKTGNEITINDFYTHFYPGGRNIWSDGDNIYYSSISTQYVFNETLKAWFIKTWTGLTSFNASSIWTDGNNIYYSSSSTQYVLNKETSTWSKKTWSGLTSFNGGAIWTNRGDIFYSYTYALDKETSTWVEKTWTWPGANARPNDYSNIWTDGVDTFFNGPTVGSSQPSSMILDRETDTWSRISSGFIGEGQDVWFTKDNIYANTSNSTLTYIFNKETKGFEQMTGDKWICPAKTGFIIDDNTRYASNEIDYLLFKPKE